MPRIAYKDFNFRDSTLDIISAANSIIKEYTSAGYVLTLRQLYYQFVSRDLIRNKQSEYDRLGSIINDGRLGGLIDWNALEDRTRNLDSLPHWEDPADIVDAIAKQYRIDLWQDQDNHVEVWIEKEALAGVFERICQQWDVAFFSCRGYVSQSEMWSAAQRMINKNQDGKSCTILHFGDHDPSGIDMTRDIRDRMELFSAHHGADAPNVVRVALTMDQVEEHNPPPNPAKLSDSRSNSYVERFGDESWELDALPPDVLHALVEEHVGQLVDLDKFNERKDQIKRERELLQNVSNQWDEVADFVESNA